MSLLNFYTTDDYIDLEANLDNSSKPVKTNSMYLYLGGLFATSFLLGPYAVLGTGLGSAGYLYYTGLYNPRIENSGVNYNKPAQIIELTSIFVVSNND
jgi:hypothetical protein